MEKKRVILFLLITSALAAQTRLTLEQCYEKARVNYPLIKQKEYIARSREYNVKNIWMGYLPQINVSGQATYQSDVTSLPVSLPAIKIETVTKDQYKAVAEVSQTIYDGGVIGAQAEIQKSSAEVDQNKIEIELLKVKERVNQLYFGILLLEKQLVQTELVKKDLNAGLDKLTAALAGGITTKQNVDILKAELLKMDQRKIELEAARKNYIQMLGLLINQTLDEPLVLEQPSIRNITGYEQVERPELNFYSAQERLIETQTGLTLARILPKASLFFQGAYGKPTLNMLKNSFDWYYLAGARLSWSPSSFYTYSNENEIAELNKKSIVAQKEAFLLNTNISIKQQLVEIDKLKELIEVDQELIALRIAIKEAAKAQLENGVITSNDFIRELTAEDQAKQNLSIHTIQLLLAQYNYLLTVGN